MKALEKPFPDVSPRISRVFGDFTVIISCLKPTSEVTDSVDFSFLFYLSIFSLRNSVPVGGGGKAVKPRVGSRPTTRKRRSTRTMHFTRTRWRKTCWTLSSPFTRSRQRTTKSCPSTKVRFLDCCRVTADLGYLAFFSS